MKRTHRFCWPAAVLVFFLGNGVIWAQENTSSQLWTNFTLGFPQGQRLYFELDIEPKAQFSGQEAFRNIDLTPAVEFYPSSRIDLTGEATIGFTKQDDDINSFEYTARVGIRLNILSSDRKRLLPQRKVLGRIVLANFTRLEYRNFAYSGDNPSKHEWRFRDRLEFKLPLNTARMSIPKTLYFLADAEAFVPLDQQVKESFASKFRIRAGFGYRASQKWRADVLFIRDWSRNTINEYDVTMNAIDLRFQFFF